MKHGGKGSKDGAKSEVKKDRMSRTGMSGSPKKGGHGGKYTWSGDRCSMAAAEAPFESGAMDAKDPNFQDPEERTESV